MPSCSSQTSFVAGRQQGQCPKARGNWAVLDYLATGRENQISREIDIAQQEVSAYLAHATSFPTQLSRWFTGTPRPGPPVPEVKRTYDRDFHGLPLFPFENLPDEDDFALPRETDVCAPRCNEAEWRYGMAFRESQDQSPDISSLFDIETDYLSSARALSHQDAHIAAGKHVLPASDIFILSPKHLADPMTLDTVRWPFLSSESDEESDEEYNMEFVGETESRNLNFSLRKPAHRTVHIVTGADHKAWQSCTASIASLSHTDEFSLDSETPITSSNTSSLTLVDDSADAGWCDEFEEEDKEEEETIAVRSVRLTRVGQPTLIEMSRSDNTKRADSRIGCAF
ncbi:hypothetical protein F53441_2570 [Fusarium austroafricanum]|uniref:Uncharacterized protein n=1 Tax=Fusarium austroafricanum TaxID=2364996 RepID=A0A8H4NXP0_9HYPO|nr:hypothetical protein F53441_2570 [Fusarium austroafricanum]